MRPRPRVMSSFAALGRIRTGVLGKKTKEMQDLDEAPLEVETADGKQGEVYTLTSRDRDQATTAAARALTQAPTNYSIPKTKGKPSLARATTLPSPPAPAPAPVRQRCVLPAQTPTSRQQPTQRAPHRGRSSVVVDEREPYEQRVENGSYDRKAQERGGTLN